MRASSPVNVKTAVTAAFLFLIPITTSATTSATTSTECTGRCDNGNAYSVVSLDYGDVKETKIVTFDQTDGGTGLETYRTEESASSACGRLSKQFC